MPGFFSQIETLNVVYQKLIVDKHIEIDKIADYIRRGADATLKNKNGHSLLDIILSNCQDNLGSIADSRSISHEQHRFIKTISDDLGTLNTANYRVQFAESDRSRELIDLFLKIDSLPELERGTHRNIMTIVDTLNSITSFSEPSCSQRIA